MPTKYSSVTINYDNNNNKKLTNTQSINKYQTINKIICQTLNNINT